MADAGDGDWVRLELLYVSQGGVSQLDFVRVGPRGEELFFDFTCQPQYESLRGAMVDEHGAWISSTLAIERGGRSRFGFNYDERVDWPSGRPITDEAFVGDLQRHPRPWAEIPDWHPVKAQYTEESWAAEERDLT